MDPSTYAGRIGNRAANAPKGMRADLMAIAHEADCEVASLRSLAGELRIAAEHLRHLTDRALQHDARIGVCK